MDQALPERERFVAGHELCAESFDDDLADVVLCRALGEELQEDQVVVTVGNDAGEVVGLGEDQTVRVVFRSDRSEFAAERECRFDASLEIGEVLLACESGCARDEARGDFGGCRVERGAERDLAAVDYGDERAGDERFVGLFDV